MKEQTRFIILVGFVVLVAVGLWLLLRPAPLPSDSQSPPPSPIQDEDQPAARPSTPVSRREAPASRRITSGVLGTRRETTTETGQIVGTSQFGIGVVKGEVVWADTKAPVEGAGVFVEIRDYHERQKPPTVSARWRTVSGADGSFLFERLPEYRAILDENVYYRIYAQTDDAYGEGGFQLTDDEPAAYEKIELYKTGAISGRVVDTAGEPVAKAWLSSHRYRPEGSDRDTYAPTSAEGVTDEAGNFTLAHLRPGLWSFTVRTPDYVTAVSDFAPVGSDGLTITLERGNRVSGVVIDVRDESPVPNIEMQLAPTNQEVYHLYARGKSEADGTFMLANVAAGNYHVYVHDDTHVLIEGRLEVNVEEGRGVDDLRIPVTLGGVVTGRAYDVDTGEPLKDVVIRSRQCASKTHTDSDGHYRLEGLPEGRNLIGRAWKKGYLHGERREDKEVMVRLGEVMTDIDFPMKKGLHLRGKVVDRQGNPVEFARVRSTPTNDSGEGEGTQTLADGAFEHRGFSPNTDVMVVASKQGYQQAQVGPLKIGETGLEGIKLVLEPGAAIEGEVVDTRGNPMPNIHVNAQGEGHGSGDSTDTYGRFSIEGLAPGVYQLSMYDYGRYGATTRIENVQRVTVPATGTLEGIRLVFRPQQGPMIAGRVIDRSRNPIAGVSVNAHGEDDHSSHGHTRTDEEGRFELTGLKPGPHRIHAYDQRYTRMQERLVAETGDRNIEIVLAGKGTVEGRVVDARTGQPIKHFQVSHRQGLQQTLAGYTPYGRPRSFYDEKGEFALTDIDEGEATIYVQADGYALAMQQIHDVDEYTPVRGLVFRLEMGARIEGIVLDEAGQPVSGANISVRRGTTDGQPTARAARSDGRGRFLIDGVSSEIDSLHAEYEGLLPVTVDLPAGAGRNEEITIRMSRGGIIEGQITINGDPAQEYPVRVHSSSTGISRHVRTNNDGCYTISGLASGEYNINTNTPPGIATSQSTQQTGIVEEGQTTVVDFDF
ncbi:MAG: carboxypeptidase regulatory-like domain-containing protein [Candidatus Hydrogenedentota bacterium]